MIFFVELGLQNNTNPVTGLPEASKNARKFSFEYFFILIQKITAEKVVGYWFKPFGFTTSFNSKKINQVIGKKDMRIFWGLWISNTLFGVIISTFTLVTPPCILKSLAKAFEWIITFRNFLFWLECLAHWLRRLHQDDFNCIKCWKQLTGLICWYFSLRSGSLKWTV